MRSSNYAAQRLVPCECGSRESYWHGPVGLRVYCCDACWKAAGDSVENWEAGKNAKLERGRR